MINMEFFTTTGRSNSKDTASATHSEHFRLMDLPVELRLHIFEFALFQGHEERQVLLNCFDPNNLALDLICRDTRAWCRKILGDRRTKYSLKLPLMGLTDADWYALRSHRPETVKEAKRCKARSVAKLTRHLPNFMKDHEILVDLGVCRGVFDDRNWIDYQQLLRKLHKQTAGLSITFSQDCHPENPWILRVDNMASLGLQIDAIGQRHPANCSKESCNWYETTTFREFKGKVLKTFWTLQAVRAGY